MSEIFDEVNEDVRREQLKRFWDKYSLLIILLAVIVVGGVGGWKGYQYVEGKKAFEASAAFDRAIDLSEQKKHAEAEAAFTKLATDAPSGYRTLARLRAAGEAAERDKTAAVALYDAIAADRSVNTAEQDLAKVRAFAVKDLLLSSGVTEKQIVMVRPNDIKAGATSAAEGRRVEVSLQ